MAEQRLNRYVSLAAAVSRRTADEMVRAGRVTLDGIPVTDPGTHFDDGRQEVRIDGGTVVPIAEEKIYILLNKPDKVMTTMHDKEGRTTVASFVGALSTRVFPVGRLDFHTTGLLLMTNDGELAWKLTHPRFGVEKSYVAKVQGVPDRTAIHRLRKGILVDGEMTNPADVRVVESRGDKTWVVLTIAEGRYHQVRKMFEAVGHRVMKLRRVAVGPIRLAEEDTGEWRFLTPQEVKELHAYVEKREKEAVGFKLPPGRKYHKPRVETYTEKKTRSERAKVRVADDRLAERVRAVERGDLPAAGADEADEWPDWLGGPSKRRKEEPASRGGDDSRSRAKGPSATTAKSKPSKGGGGRSTATPRQKPSSDEGRPPVTPRPTTTPRPRPPKDDGRPTTTAPPRPPKDDKRPTTTPRPRPPKDDGRPTTTPRPRPSKEDERPTTTPRPRPSNDDGRPTKTPRPWPSGDEGPPTTTPRPWPSGEESPPTGTPRSRPSKGEGRSTTTPRSKPSKGEGRSTTTPRQKPSKGERPGQGGATRREDDSRPRKGSAPPPKRGGERDDRPRRTGGDAPPRRDEGRYAPGAPEKGPGSGMPRPEGGFAEKGKGKGHVGAPGKGRGDGPAKRGGKKAPGKSAGKAPGRKAPGGRSGGSAPKGKGGAKGAGKGRGPSKGAGKGRGGGR